MNETTVVWQIYLFFNFFYRLFLSQNSKSIKQTNKQTNKQRTSAFITISYPEPSSFLLRMLDEKNEGLSLWLAEHAQ